MTFAQFDRAAAGSTVRNLNTTLASKVTIPLPPLEEQRRLVERLDRLKEFTSELESRYAEAIADLDQLRQSLLAKAFAGEEGRRLGLPDAIKRAVNSPASEASARLESQIYRSTELFRHGA